MIDTIRVKYHIRPTSKQLEAWTIRSVETQTGKRYSLTYNPTTENQVLPRYTYYPLGYDNTPILTLEFSLPKLVFGNNYQMISNVEQAMIDTNDILEKIPNTPELNIADGILIRLDFCYNHQVGDAVDDYIKAISNLEYPHRRTKHHRFEGVEFRAKHKTTKFYGKERESGFIEAHGILRQETTMLDAKDIQKLLRSTRPALLDLSDKIIADALEDDLRKLGLLNNSIATRDTALETLCNTHGEYAGVYYSGLLSDKMEKSKKQLVKQIKTHPRSLDRRLRKIVQSGIPLTLTDREVPLPPLNIDLSSIR
jgi:hypothetical protein